MFSAATIYSTTRPSTALVALALAHQVVDRVDPAARERLVRDGLEPEALPLSDEPRNGCPRFRLGFLRGHGCPYPATWTYRVCLI